MLQLQWKELDYLHKNFVNLTVTSTVLVGFGITSFQISQTYKPQAVNGTPGDENPSIWELDEFHWGSWHMLSSVFFEAFFVATAALGLAWNILCLFISTLSLMCGPGMALRGPEGSVTISVRHSESMLKRALRFFGRGITAFTLSMVTIGLRQFHTISFVGGLFSVTIGCYCLHMLWTYGGDIAEKFYVSPDRAVRGTFIHTANGVPVWKNTSVERQAAEVPQGYWFCGMEFGRGLSRWRPEGHGATTPLWRADKLISFPAHDEERLQRVLTNSLKRAEGSKGSGCLPSTDQTAANERDHMQHLLMNAQGAGAPSAVGGSEAPITFEALNPWQAIELVGQALTGGNAGTSGAEVSGRGAVRSPDRGDAGLAPEQRRG